MKYYGQSNDWKSTFRFLVFDNRMNCCDLCSIAVKEKEATKIKRNVPENVNLELSS